MINREADLKTELKWIFYNKKFMLILFFCVFFASVFFFSLGFDLGVKKTIDSALEVFSNENMEEIIKWGCSVLDNNELVNFRLNP